MRLAVYNGLSCGGCDPVFFLDVLEELGLTSSDIVFWPKVSDRRLRDLESQPPESLDLALVTGAVSTSEQIRLLKVLRSRSLRLVAVGACALWGGVAGLGWLEGSGPEPVPEIVTPDFLLPGCPPEPETFRKGLKQALSAKTSSSNQIVGAEDFPLCEECDRRRRPFRLRNFQRWHTCDPEARQCFLQLGVPCAGPVTRAGCQARCPRAGYPCLGCYGPLPGIEDPGERLLSGLVSALIPAKASQALETLVDPVGSLYRFNLATHPLLRKRKCPDE